MMHTFSRGTGVTPRPRLLWLGLAAALPLAACDVDSLLEVEEPTFATPGALARPEGLPTLYAGAIGDFQIAYSGSGGAVDSYLSVSTLFSDEYYVADTFTTRNATDQRNQFPTVQGNTSDAAYNRLQYARRAAAEVAQAVADVAPQGTADPRFAVLRSLEGYTIIALADGFCGAVPLSTAAGGAPGDLGQPLSTQQLYNEAVSRFDVALQGNPNSNLARVGKGRALLNNGQHAAAAAAVAAVPTNFMHFVEHSANSTRQHNPLFSLVANGRYGISDVEGGNGLPFRSAQDPRLPWIRDPAQPNGFDASVPLFKDLRHPAFNANVLLASGIEARMIEAEAALRAGNVETWLAKLNEPRAQVRTLMTAMIQGYAARVPGPNNPTATLDPLTDPGTDAARVDLMMQERAFWLFSTGHRHADLRRLIRQYNRTQDQVFPTGTHHRGGTYGRDVNMPIPFQETQNPNFTVEMCNTQQA
jgi:starch-binding outer membrane protein, SusD/RagB family